MTYFMKTARAQSRTQNLGGNPGGLTLPFASFGLVALAGFIMLGAVGAQAETKTHDTYVMQRDLPGTQKINFADFDVNHDGILSRYEVGTKLFYIFDTDGNEVIDNIEYDRPMVLSIIPMEKQEIKTIDFNDDGIADAASYNKEEFFERSMLARFDDGNAGVSAASFLNRVYWQLDDNKDKTVDIKEWRDAYIKSVTPSAANPNRYNQ
jgi:hypothetical protein